MEMSVFELPGVVGVEPHSFRLYPLTVVPVLLQAVNFNPSKALVLIYCVHPAEDS